MRWQRQHFDCPAQATVADVCASLTARVRDQLIEPLCVSALNTPSRTASGAVFLRVLRDALFSGTGGSDLLLPTTDLGAVLPEAALHWLQQHGADIRLGQRWEPDPSTSGIVVLACPAWEAARLTRDRHPDWSAQAHALQHAAITTVYVQHPDPGFRLPHPMMALPSDAQRPVQFVFDRGQLLGLSQRGLLACVVSDSSGTREALERQVLAQLRDQLSDALGQLNGNDCRIVQTVVEKRATFVCSPGVERPSPVIGPGWWACGDYVAGPYPATLEGAVRSGREVIDQIAQAREREGRL
jgi:hypothetical protein